jgi:eukaryotic-like serine/threonine-protein kinase
MSTSPPLVVADRYRLVAPLGQGGMGRVWRATDVVLHRDVAIKELVPPPGLTFDERRELRERSLREARAIARLNNINVVRVFDVLRTDADPWIVMEYVPSRSLQDMLATDGPFPPVRAVEIGLGMLNALRAAHRNGVVHRDVKPGNVLIGEDGRVVLTDFGLATVPGDPNVTRTGLVLGSPAYIAPERARDGTAGPAADLWSLGATLYAAVEGASPFARPSAMATLAALATENVPPARNAGPLKPVLNGLLRKDPTHRISAEEAERLLLRANGRRSRLGFPMSPTMRRPGVGRERSALSPTAPPAASGSAPAVPGPRPPATPGRPPVSPAAAGPSGEGRRPIYAPGKASVGPPGRPADTPARVDGPPVRSTPDQDLSSTGSNAPNSTTDQINEAAPSRAPAQGARAEGAPARGALAKGTRGAYGTITPGEGTRSGRPTHRSAKEADGGAAAETARASVAAEREAVERAAAEREAAEREAAERAEAERQAAAKAVAERQAAERA